MKSRRVPRAMRIAPRLDPEAKASAVQPRFALLINPFYRKDEFTSFGKHVLTPSLALTSVAAATPAQWEVRYWDENLLQGPPPLDPMPQVVGISVHLTFAKRAFELAAWFRKRGAIVVFGGLHVLSCPEDCAPHADAICVGDGVQTWEQILNDVDAGILQPRAVDSEAPQEPRIYRGDYRNPYRNDPPPRRDLLDRRSFLTTTSLIATRGCHNRCGFCYLATDGLFMPYQMRDTEQVTSELTRDNQPYAVFIDNNLGSRPEYLRALCRAMRPLKTIWSAAVSIDVSDDPTLVREMALAGCTGVFVGFESLTDQNLADARKKTPLATDYARRIRILHDNGIQVNGSFVLGFDHDKPDCFEKLCHWIERQRMECATLHILTPYPGTPLFRQMQAENRILHTNYDLYDTGHVVFQPKHMTVEQLQEGYAWCYRHLFSAPSIWRRRPPDARAVLPYLAMCYLYKRSNWLWPFLIRHRLTGIFWRPLVKLTRWRHLQFRKRLERTPQSLEITPTPPLRHLALPASASQTAPTETGSSQIAVSPAFPASLC